jgi:2-keto-4-pentenoate hydratase
MSIDAAAGRLIEATQSGTHCLPVNDLIGPTDLAAAYAVQDQVCAARLTSGDVQSGWKVAFSAKPVMQMFGIAEPASGRLFHAMEVMSGATIPWAATSQPRVEGEIALVFGRDLKGPVIGMADLFRAVEFILPAIEVVGSRISGKQLVTDAVADNAGASHYVLGSNARRPDQVDLVDSSLAMTISGQPAGRGTGRVVYGSPLNAGLWLARHLVARGLHVKAGDVVMAGALFGPAPVAPEDEVEVTINGIGSVWVAFGGV